MADPSASSSLSSTMTTQEFIISLLAGMNGLDLLFVALMVLLLVSPLTKEIAWTVLKLILVGLAGTLLLTLALHALVKFVEPYCVSNLVFGDLDAGTRTYKLFSLIRGSHLFKAPIEMGLLKSIPLPVIEVAKKGFVEWFSWSSPMISDQTQHQLSFLQKLWRWIP